ncbi:NAD(P)-binding domain-containing protein [Streptomyces sp. NPDC048340]|uniref:NAD(P)-binding domain-containing protein n=1 Tax=Streptomyces sp. NPDC048340 TaxID=3365537 RepID=UPI00370FEB70
MRYAVLGTGIVGRTVAARLASLDHEVLIGTRDPEATLARAEYADWAAEHPQVGLAAFPEAARRGRYSSTPPAGGSASPPWRRPRPSTSTARS